MKVSKRKTVAVKERDNRPHQSDGVPIAAKQPRVDVYEAGPSSSRGELL